MTRKHSAYRVAPDQMVAANSFLRGVPEQDEDDEGEEEDEQGEDEIEGEEDEGEGYSE